VHAVSMLRHIRMTPTPRKKVNCTEKKNENQKTNKSEKGGELSGQKGLNKQEQRIEPRE